MPSPLDVAIDAPPSVLPLPRLVLLLIASVGLSWFMVPHQEELVERLLKDKQYERVVAVLQDGAHSMRKGDLSGLQKLSSSQLAAIAQLLKLTPREQLHTIFDPAHALTYDAYIHNIALAAVRFVDVMPPAEAYELIAPNLNRAPEEMRVDLLRVIARNAHAVGQPTLAARVQQRALQSPTATWQDAQDLVQSFRWSAHSTGALPELQQWLARHEARLTVEQLAQARMLQYSLALECGQPSIALDASLRALEKLPPADPAHLEWLERARTTALACIRTKDVIPPLQQHVASMPESALPTAQLRDEAAREPARFVHYRRWLTELARWSDWNSMFDSAFDAHARLAVMGDVDSLDRCMDLQDFLGRGEDCVALLLALGDIPQREQLKLTLARMLAELGEDVKAKPLFEAWLKTHPGDRDARYQYCCLLEDMGEEDAARRALEDMIVLHPHDVPAIKQLADARIRDADYEGALKLYEELPTDAHTRETLENYAMIAESLDDHAAQFCALHLAAQEQPDVEAYLDLAEAAVYLPDPQPAIDALLEGLDRIPQSAVLRIALAQSFVRAEQSDDAVATLMNDVLKNNLEAAQLLLSLSDAVSDPVKTLEFIGNDLDQRFPLTERTRLQLAVLNHRAGRVEASRKLFASVKENESTYRILAESRLQIHDCDEAARLMNAHLHASPRQSAADWDLLGDIFEELGRLDDAKKAYDTSLALLTADLPDTAAN